MVAGHKVTTTKTVETQVRRPDRVQIEMRSPQHSRGWWYDGKTLTLLDRAHNVYGSLAVPETIDKVLDAANDRFGINFPLEDLLVNDPYASASAAIKGGAYFGKVTILGDPVPAHRLQHRRTGLAASGSGRPQPPAPEDRDHL